MAPSWLSIKDNYNYLYNPYLSIIFARLLLGVSYQNITFVFYDI